MFGIVQKQKDANKVLQIPIGKIKPNPRQARKQFEQDALLGLAESIKQNGILQPLTVRYTGNGDYELVAGERRLRASLLAGLTQVPCIEIEADEKQSAVLCLLENLQRQDLNFFEEAMGIARLIEICGLTQEEIAMRLGKSQSTIANKLRLLHLNKIERKEILQANLTERHARALLRVDESIRESVLQQIIARNLNVGETDKLIDSLMQPKEEKIHQRCLPVIKDIRIFMNTVTNAVNVMKKAGIEAVAVKQEYDTYFEYTVRIPKSASTVKSKTA